MHALFDGLTRALAELLIGIALTGLLSVCGGIALAAGLRLRGLRWTWAGLAVFPAMLASYRSLWAALVGVGAWLVACVAGMVWHSHDLMAGGDHAEAARERLGIIQAVELGVGRRQAARNQRGWVSGGRLEVGRDAQRRPVWIPAGGRSGSHALILGATGSGKTCTEAWIAARLIGQGHGAVAIDPKGDRLLREELQLAAGAAGVPFLQWSPQGPLAYNPYAHGTDTEIADKALSGEAFTEPHYLRQAQRYVGHAVRCMRAADLPLTAATLMVHMDPEQLEQAAKGLPEEHTRAVHTYLDSLGPRQRQDLGGVRDRLSILAESDIGPWLDPQSPGGAIDLPARVAQGAVVYFALEADRWPLLAKMLAAAIVGDLITLAAGLQARAAASTLVLIDEFSSVSPEQIARLFARGRSAGMSLLLATQEIADLKAAGQQALCEQAIGNVETVIAFRQNVPESAELIAGISGTRPTWITTQRTALGALGHRPAGGGTRRRGHEHAIHPSRIKQLGTGQAVVITPGSGRPPAIAQMHHPGACGQPGAMPGGAPHSSKRGGPDRPGDTQAARVA